MPKQEKQVIDHDNINPNASYTVPDVAQAVGWSNGWLRKLIKEGRVTAIRPNGHEYRISGKEVSRIMQDLDAGGRIAPKRGAIRPEDVNHIPVSPDLMPMIDPDWDNGAPPVEKPPPKKGFFEALDADIRAGNPLLFGSN